MAIAHVLEPLFKLPSLNLIKVSHPHSFQLLHGSSMAWVRPVTVEGLFIVHYPPALRNPTAKHGYPQTKADGGQHGGNKGKQESEDFVITFINSLTNQMETMRFYVRPIRLAVIQKKYIIHSDGGDVEKASTKT